MNQLETIKEEFRQLIEWLDNEIYRSQKELKKAVSNAHMLEISHEMLAYRRCLRAVKEIMKQEEQDEVPTV